MKRLLAFLLTLVLALPAGVLAEGVSDQGEETLVPVLVMEAPVEEEPLFYALDAAQEEAEAPVDDAGVEAVEEQPVTEQPVTEEPVPEKGRTLIKGMEGQDVLQAQVRLQWYGYYTGLLDGKFGASMYTAVVKFQRRNELTVDGKIGPSTRAVLFSDNAVGKDDPEAVGTLGYGSHGDAVKELQRQLRETYYYTGTIDGIFGSAVTRAVKWFQASAGLNADGKVGSRTKDALYNRTARIFNGGIPVRELYQGIRGYDVMVLQNKLADMNYNLGYATPGYYDSYTVAAVKAFQANNGLKVDGRATSTLRRYLWPTTVSAEEEEQKQYEGTPDDPFTERTLKVGNYGEDVASMQMRLKSAGYLLGNADGIFGANTKKAVIRLQKDYNLKPDGIVGPQTWAVVKMLNVSNAEPVVVDEDKTAVGANVTKLRRGSRGAQVKKLQQQLIQLGYLPAGEDDGKYGPKTARAVMNFQSDVGITVDGVAGSQTFVRLNEVLGLQWDVSID
jgi:peptidoglycan hydrolase-like protein with peptidoglycan-binding domain